jgi:hypothetical protein
MQQHGQLQQHQALLVEGVQEEQGLQQQQQQEQEEEQEVQWVQWVCGAVVGHATLGALLQGVL